MRLGEALAERSALQRRIGELRMRVGANASHQEGEEPAENAGALLDELVGVHDQLAVLIARINVTNTVTKLEDGRTLTYALAQRERLGGLIKSYQGAAQSSVAVTGFRYQKSELATVRDLDVKDLNATADDCAAALRELDNKIQAANWATELAG